jgi:hypothetical protein
MSLSWNQKEEDKDEGRNVLQTRRNPDASDEIKRITGELRLQSLQTTYSSDITTRYLNVSDKYAILETHEQDEENFDYSNASKQVVYWTCKNARSHDSSSSSCSTTSSFSSLIGTSMDVASRSPESQSSNSKYSDDDNSSFYYSATSTDSGMGPEKSCRHSRNDSRFAKTKNEKNAYRFRCEETNVQDDIFSNEACKFNNCAETFIDLHLALGDEYRAIFHSISISHDSANHELVLNASRNNQKWDKVNDATTFVLPVQKQEDTVVAAGSTVSYTTKEYLALDLGDDSWKKDDDTAGSYDSNDHSDTAMLSRLVHSSISEDGTNISISENYLQEEKEEEWRAVQHLPSPRSSIKILREARKKASMIQEELIRAKEEAGSGFFMFMPAFMRPMFSLLERRFLDSFCNQHKLKPDDTDALSPGDENRIINHLYSAIRCHNSLQAMAHLDKNLDESKVWVTCYDTLSPDGNLMPVQVLPLHTACLSKSPVVLVKKILEAYPEAVRKRAGNSKYPIHLACESGADPAVISLLLESWPESLYACDGQGNIPLTNLVSSSPFCQNKIETMKLFLSAFEKQTNL